MNDIHILAADIVAYFDSRSSTYDSGDLHPKLTARLIEKVTIKEGQIILDVATGTGLIAIEAARRVSRLGRVIALDISRMMLEEARRKIDASGLQNIELREGDACLKEFPENEFDLILCSAALVYMADINAVLRRWYRFLKPGGYVAFDAPAENSTAAGSVMAKLANKNGFSLGYTRLWTEEACKNSMQDTGFEEICVDTEIITQRTISPSEIVSVWEGSIANPLMRKILGRVIN
jgi:ubiquinone/menaquinone biosynthesis C-methylase UbiE